MNYDLAISPCPNDTYIFYHFIQRGFFSHPLQIHFEDVEELNLRAMNEKRHILTKLSYAAILRVQDDYQLLSSGGAMGRGCGPLLIHGKGLDGDALFNENSDSVTVLVPGLYTTASLLLNLYLHDKHIDRERIRILPERYDRILNRLESGEKSLGVIIHEERFTYRSRKLLPVQDLGEWWESLTAAPIPLGGICARRDMPDDLRIEAEEKIRQSILLVRENIVQAMPFIKQHAQSMEESVIKSHIDLYVNEFSVDAGEEGRRAVQILEERARKADCF